jgi:hypothetical protein
MRNLLQSARYTIVITLVYRFCLRMDSPLEQKMTSGEHTNVEKHAFADQKSMLFLIGIVVSHPGNVEKSRF